MKSAASKIGAIAVVCLTNLSGAVAATVPFSEGFDADASAWTNANSLAPTYSAAGGADGGGFISFTTDVADPGFGGQTVFRCNSLVGCSGGAFSGDWESEVGSLGFLIRHDSATPLSFFARIATPGNFPAYAAESTVIANPGEWTSFSFDIFDGNPLLTPEFGTFGQTFGNVGRFQIGVSIPTGFTASGVTFDLDQVTLAPVPLPAAAWMLFGGVASLFSQRRSVTVV